MKKKVSAYINAISAIKERKKNIHVEAIEGASLFH
jgi:hypothetical protein